MPQTIYWLPNNAPNIVSYEILSSDTGQDGEYSVLTTVAHQIPGPNYNSDTGVFFYTDPDEISYRWYQLQTIDQFGNRGANTAPTPFQADNDPEEAPSIYTVLMTADYGAENNYQYVTPDGDPIEDATVRIYTKENWDAENTTYVLGITKTLSDGTWKSPIVVNPGRTYTIVFHKTNEYGPDTVEVTV